MENKRVTKYSDGTKYRPSGLMKVTGVRGIVQSTMDLCDNCLDSFDIWADFYKDKEKE